ncbi:MAG: hypothetical protein RLZZ450_3684 [Pseudomonadota bacterium]|jgi:AraC family transcriptional regulator
MRLQHELSPAAEALAMVLDVPPALVTTLFRADTQLTRRWLHGAVHDALPAMRGHVVTTYHDCDCSLVWQSGAARVSGRARRGVINLIPQGHDGRWEIAGPVEVSHVYLSEQRLQSCADDMTGGSRVELLDRAACEDALAASVLELLSRPGLLDDVSSRLFVEQALDLLCIQLIRAHSSFGSLTVSARRGLAGWQVKRVTEHMLARLHDDVGLDELAALVQLSRSHFCTAFRLATGCTPHEWLVVQRIARAKQWLADPELPVTEVALAVGYQTPSAFAASFRKLVGVSPSTYRRQL